MSENIVIYELPKNIFKEYRRITAYNKGITYEIAQKKLTRNAILGKTLYKDREREIILYGSLKIRVNHRDGRKILTGLWNFCEPYDDWEMNYSLRNKLNKELGLED